MYEKTCSYYIRTENKLYFLREYFIARLKNQNDSLFAFLFLQDIGESFLIQDSV